MPLTLFPDWLLRVHIFLFFSIQAKLPRFPCRCGVDHLIEWWRLWLILKLTKKIVETFCFEKKDFKFQLPTNWNFYRLLKDESESESESESVSLISKQNNYNWISKINHSIIFLTILFNKITTKSLREKKKMIEPVDFCLLFCVNFVFLFGCMLPRHFVSITHL